jgi:L-malate glycosyltransferase
MRILWVTNIAFGKLAELAGQSAQNTSGSWLNAALDAFSGDGEYSIVVATIGRTPEIKTRVEGNITYCLLPGGNVGTYQHTLPDNRRVWETVYRTYKPDLVQVWGTEFTHGYLALQVMREVPAVIYMQGVLGQIARYYRSGMSDAELRASVTLRDVLKRDSIKQAQQSYYRRAVIEEEMIKTARRVIVENDWCSTQCRAIAPDCVSYRSKLPIREEFFRQCWDPDGVEPYTIMSNAAGYPIKGLHILIKAMSLIVRRYPQAKLYVPGEQSPFGKTYLQRLRQNGFTKNIRSLVERLGLKKHIEFLGRLTSAQMAERMAKSNVFAMPSSIENHSSTLMEAMIVGTPCVSSYVGGVPEYVEHGKNGLLYRFEEFEVLAAHIMSLFENPQFALQIASAASKQMRQERAAINLKNGLISIYQQILSSI